MRNAECGVLSARLQRSAAAVAIVVLAAVLVAAVAPAVAQSSQPAPGVVSPDAQRPAPLAAPARDTSACKPDTAQLRVLALDDLDEDRRSDPELLEALRPAATAFDLGDGEVKVLNLTMTAKRE